MVIGTSISGQRRIQTQEIQYPPERQSQCQLFPFRRCDPIIKEFANTLNAGISVYASKSKDKKYDFTMK